MVKLTSNLLLFILFMALVPGKVLADRWSESYKQEAMGEYEKAAQAIEPIIQARNSEFAVLRHGWLNYLQGKYDEAIADYQKALELNADSLDAMMGITLPLLAQKRWREAASYATRVLAVAPWNYYAHVRLMICEEGQKQWKILELHAESASRRYPADATILVYLARARARQGKESAARDTYRMVLERIPNHLEATQYLQHSQ